MRGDKSMDKYNLIIIHLFGSRDRGLVERKCILLSVNSIFIVKINYYNIFLSLEKYDFGT